MAKVAAVAAFSGAVWANPLLAAALAIAYGVWIALQFRYGPQTIYRLHLWWGASLLEARQAEIAFRKRLAERVEALITTS